MKARDVIPNWPLPRSTSPPPWDGIEEFKWRTMFRRFYYTEGDIYLFGRDARENEKYHRGQQAMVDAFREGRLKPDSIMQVWLGAFGL
jgi:hypothetical protein